MPQQSRFSDFRGGRDSSDILPDGGAEKTKVVGVPPGVSAFSPIGGGTGCTGPYFLFSGISARAIDGETIFLATTPPPSGLERLGVSFPASAVPAVRGLELRGGVEFGLPGSSDFVVGSTVVDVSVYFKKTLSRDCGVSCFVYAMEHGTERTTTRFGESDVFD